MLASMGGRGHAPPPPPRTFSNLKALKRHFQHSQANSCVKKVPKIDCYFLDFDKIRDSQVKLGQSRLIRDRGWTLCKSFWGVRGSCSSGKNKNLRSSNCWKSYHQSYHHHVIFVSQFKSFTIPSGGPFWLLGGACAPRAPPLPTGLSID